MYFFRMVLFNLINLYKKVYGGRGMRYVLYFLFETCCPGGHTKIGYKNMTMLIFTPCALDRRAEVTVFAASWVALLILRDNGYRLEKPAARVLKLLDSEVDQIIC